MANAHQGDYEHKGCRHSCLSSTPLIPVFSNQFYTPSPSQKKVTKTWLDTVWKTVSNHVQTNILQQLITRDSVRRWLGINTEQDNRSRTV